MDAFNDPEVTEITLMASSQIGKSETFILNPIGYAIALDPCPILLVQPTLELAEAFSKDRLAPMIQDTPCLKNLVSIVKSKESTNTIRHKDFPGGHITLAGANSAASLAMRPIRLLFCDEIDRYPESAGTEGDPITIAAKRTTTFWNKKEVKTSSPTIEGFSRIDHSYKNSDQRLFKVPCPLCNFQQVLRWGGKEADFGIKWKDQDPNTAYYLCEKCHGEIYEGDKIRMLNLGFWEPQAEFKGHAGFWINEIYSPWVSWSQMVANYYKAKPLPETLKVFVNTSLAETWKEKAEEVKEGPLLARREHYGPKVPGKVLLITAGVDVQDDRLEISLIGYGLMMEKWLLAHYAIPGDPAKKELWTDLDMHLERTFTTEDGVQLRIVSVMIDSGGHHTQAVYDYVRSRELKRIYATKGMSSKALPVVRRPKSKNKKGVTLYITGVDQAKEVIYSHLKIVEPGPGYFHFPFHDLVTNNPIDEEYFLGLTAEKRVTEYNKGFPKLVWKQHRNRNEPLDCCVYSLAAYYNLNPNMEEIHRRRKKKVKTEKPETKTAAVEPEEERPNTIQTPKRHKPKSRGGFVSKYRSRL